MGFWFSGSFGGGPCQEGRAGRLSHASERECPLRLGRRKSRVEAAASLLSTHGGFREPCCCLLYTHPAQKLFGTTFMGVVTDTSAVAGRRPCPSVKHLKPPQSPKISTTPKLRSSCFRNCADVATLEGPNSPNAALCCSHVQNWAANLDQSSERPNFMTSVCCEPIPRVQTGPNLLLPSPLDHFCEPDIQMPVISNTFWDVREIYDTVGNMRHDINDFL